MRKPCWPAHSATICLLFAAAAATVLAQGSVDVARSTSEERTRLVALTHKLEGSPLEPSLHADTEWAIKGRIQVPDIHVGIRSTMLADSHAYKVLIRDDDTTDVFGRRRSLSKIPIKPKTNLPICRRSRGGMEGIERHLATRFQGKVQDCGRVGAAAELGEAEGVGSGRGSQDGPQLNLMPITCRSRSSARIFISPNRTPEGVS